ncbi:MAG TPA: Rieske 2Fe-2S domain-containing protein [Alphaproteobacteria bacterium]
MSDEPATPEPPKPEPPKPPPVPVLTVKPGEALCRLDEMADPGSREFIMQRGNDSEEIFVIRQGDEAFGYVNVCPHRYLPLNWKPHVFLNYDKTRIICIVHAATFDMRDGVCRGGPCPGQALEPVALRVADGVIYLAD